jgi:hypothetical protein
MAEDQSVSSSYRIKFDKKEFLQLVEIATPKIIYRRKKFHFFAFDGFVMYSNKCSDADFKGQTIIEAMEFSNYFWQV